MNVITIETVKHYANIVQVYICINILHFFSGKPAPRVVWYRNNRIYSAASAKSNNGLNLVTVNNITLDSLGREDVHTKLTCQTSNFEATTLRTSVELDMKCTYLKTILCSSVDIFNYRVTQIKLDFFKPPNWFGGFQSLYFHGREPFSFFPLSISFFILRSFLIHLFFTSFQLFCVFFIILFNWLTRTDPDGQT